MEYITAYVLPRESSFQNPVTHARLPPNRLPVTPNKGASALDWRRAVTLLGRSFRIYADPPRAHPLVLLVCMRFSSGV
jgi:hypothetical protein